MNIDFVSKAKQAEYYAKIKKLESKLRARHLTPIKNGAKISIQELIVSQDMDENKKYHMGEFLLNPIDIIPTPSEFDPTDDVCREDETDENTIERIYESIEYIALLASQEHLKCNYNITNPDLNIDEFDDYLNILLQKAYEPKESAKDLIFRVTSNEFSFFTSMERGPLSQRFFRSLVKKIESLAMDLPENLYLFLSSFAVCASDKPDVSLNIAISVQCGPMPIINLQAKQFISRIDANYPNTFSMNIVELDSNAAEFTNELDDEQTRLSNLLQKKGVQFYHAPIKEYAKRLNLLCQMDPTFLPPQGLRETLSHLILLCESGQLNQQLAQHFDKAIKSYIELYFTQIEKTVNSINENHFYPFLYSFAASLSGVEINYENQYELTTLNGNKICSGLEICLDHDRAETRNRLRKSFEKANAGQFIILPEYYSQVVSSNTLSLNEKSMVAENNIVTFADIAYPAVGSYSSLENDTNNCFAIPTLLDGEYEIDPLFGPKTYLSCFIPHKMPKIKRELYEQFQALNNFNIRLEAIRFLRTQAPGSEYIGITLLIQELLYQKILNDFYQIDSELSSSMKEFAVLTLEGLTQIYNHQDMLYLCDAMSYLKKVLASLKTYPDQKGKEILSFTLNSHYEALKIEVLAYTECMEVEMQFEQNRERQKASFPSSFAFSMWKKSQHANDDAQAKAAPDTPQLTEHSAALYIR